MARLQTHRRLGVAVIALALLGAAGAGMAGRHQDPAPAVPGAPVLDVEKQVREAGFRFYSSSVLGDFAGYSAAARFPIRVLRDGVGTVRDEAACKALLGKLAAGLKTRGIDDSARARLTQAMLAVFEDAAIEFVGANTATVTFPVRAGSPGRGGELLCQVVLYRTAGKWQVIEEITDSAPIPANFGGPLQPPPTVP